MSLESHLSTILGVVEPPRVAAASRAESVPERPQPLYEYRITVYRHEYGTAFITATNASDALDQCQSEDIDWSESGDIEWHGADTEQESDEPVNRDDIEAWDDQYGNRYDAEGDPKCSNCDSNYPADKLAIDPDDSNAWYCCDCAPTL